jgi:hypothetical protein
MKTHPEIIDFITGDQPTTCPHDGVRTEMLKDKGDHTIEGCPLCGRRFNFWHDESEA